MLDHAAMQTCSDAQLVLLSGQGDRSAFDELAGRWGQQLYRFLIRFVGDPDEAQDVCQETLLKAFTNINRLRSPEHFRAWLHQIAVNVCRDRSRARRQVSLVPLESEGRPTNQELVCDRPSPMSHAHQADLREQLAQLLSQLPDEQRTAILLAELQGFTSAEISRLTGVPSATIRSRIFYGLKALRRMLPEYGITDEHLRELEVKK